MCAAAWAFVYGSYTSFAISQGNPLLRSHVRPAAATPLLPIRLQPQGCSGIAGTVSVSITRISVSSGDFGYGDSSLNTRELYAYVEDDRRRLPAGSEYLQTDEDGNAIMAPVAVEGFCEAAVMFSG